MTTYIESTSSGAALLEGEMFTASGRKINLLDPRPEDIYIEDIAHCLSNLCRYGGQTKQFYSVAEHSCRVAEAVPEVHKKWALLHDASEAYLGDVVRPLKYLPDMSVYREIEKKFEEVICERFGLSLEMPKMVKLFDGILLATEMRDITNIPEAHWSQYQTLPTKIIPMKQETAKLYFIETARLYGLLG
jgi:5'-deoxynucleotidase YfbR-like HD superfamily hydrolase